MRKLKILLKNLGNATKSKAIGAELSSATL